MSCRLRSSLAVQMPRFMSVIKLPSISTQSDASTYSRTYWSDDIAPNAIAISADDMSDAPLAFGGRLFLDPLDLQDAGQDEQPRPLLADLPLEVVRQRVHERAR